MARVKLCIAYNGAGFAGWQLQAETQGRNSPPRTVQGVLEDAINGLLREIDPEAAFARVTGSGRTDSGVHADAQVAHFDAPDAAFRLNWQEALNRRLPDDLSIIEASAVDDAFNARFDAKAKIYNYSLWLNRKWVPPRLKPFVWAAGPLNLEAMRAAALLLCGEHDFASFQNAGAEPGPTVRTLYAIECRSVPLPGCPGPGEGFMRALPPELGYSPDALRYIVWSFAGNGFLKQMVRNIMGFLAAVGQGKLERETLPERLEEIFAARDRRLMPGVTAPPQGLCLHRVIY